MTFAGAWIAFGEVGLVVVTALDHATVDNLYQAHAAPQLTLDEDLVVDTAQVGHASAVFAVLGGLATAAAAQDET